jgi:hypothetical protein
MPAARPRLTTAQGEPIALRGRLLNANGVVFNALATTPAGRGRVGVEWQLATVGQAFDPPEAGTWTDSGPIGGPPADISAALGFSLLEGERYRWRLRVATASPYFPHGRWLTNEPGAVTLYGVVVGSQATGVDDARDLPILGSPLAPPYPNPFNPSTTLAYELRRPGPVRLRVFDLAGRLVRTLVSGERDAGSYTVTWNGRDDGGRALASGSYHAVLEVAGERYRRTMTLVK